MLRKILTLSSAFAVLLAVPGAPSGSSKSTAVSLQHLNSLKGTVQTPAGPLAVWHIYADPTARGYQPLGAPGEGISCVDDVARALVVYLEHFELTGDPESLDHARDAVRFLAYTRQEDGTYANFVMADGSLNLTGPTSRPGVNWWMARAMWGLAKAYSVFKTVDPDEADYIAELLAPSVKRLQDEVRAKQPPGAASRAVIAGTGADVSAAFLIAVSLLYAAAPDGISRDSLYETAAALALGLRASQSGDTATPPYRAVMPNPGSPAVWTSWGSHGMEALALAAITFDEPEWLSWAAETAHALGTYLAAGPGALAGQGPAPILYPQIAYGQSPWVRGLALLHQATGNPLYSDLALLTASWFFGNNPAGEAVYDTGSGRTYDGIDGGTWGNPGRVNYSAGAESTIEGLLALLALQRITPNGLLRTAELRRPTGAGPVVIDAESYRPPGFGRIEYYRQQGLAGSRPSGDGYIVVYDGAEMSYLLDGLLSPESSYRIDLVHGGARVTPALIHVVIGEELIGSVEVGRDPAGDRLRTTAVGIWKRPEARTAAGSTGSLAADGRASTGNAPAGGTVLRLVVEGGPIVLDAIVLHPTVMWRKLQSPEGTVTVLRNTTSAPRRVRLDRLAAGGGSAAGPEAPADGDGGCRAGAAKGRDGKACGARATALRAAVYDAGGRSVPDPWADDSSLVLPPYGFALVVE